MDTFETLFTRRSIRKYTNQVIDEPTIKKLLSAGMIAPTAGNTQRWQFLVLTDRAALDSVADVHPYAGMIREAPLAILVCGDSSPHKYAGFGPQEGGAAIQNIMLAARALNIGSVWCGVHPVQEREESIRQLFKLPPHIVPIGLVVLGYPAQPFTQQDRYDEAKVHYNVW